MRKPTNLIINALLAITLTATAAASQAAAPPQINGQTPSLANVLQHIMPAVVNIAGQGVIAPPENPFAEPNAPAPGEGKPTPDQPHRFESVASGVIIDANNGYILTNAHALRDVKIITVTLGDGRVLKAKMIGIDPPSDIAVIQIKADHLTPASEGNSDNLKVGDFVAAIGNPFGLNQTVTSGIVSGLGRSGLGIEGYENFIQTDASINPGNSGGALINSEGQLIGINTAILAPAGGNIGIGFAIPINMARSVMTQLVKYGSVKRGLIGVIIQDLTPALANALNLPNQTGALVAQLALNSPAAAAGIKIGDVIQSVNGETVKNGTALRNAIGLLRVGNVAHITLIRQGKPLSFSLVTADPEQYTQANEQNDRYLFGMGLRAFDEQLPTAGHVVGVEVMGVSEDSAAWLAGIRPGNVILSAEQTPVSSVAQLQKIAQQAKDGLLLDISQRDGSGAAFVVVK